MSLPGVESDPNAPRDGVWRTVVQNVGRTTKSLDLNKPGPEAQAGYESQNRFAGHQGVTRGVEFCHDYGVTLWNLAQQ